MLQSCKGKKDGFTRLSEARFLLKDFTMLLEFGLNMKAAEALKATNDVADMLSKAASTEKKNYSEYLLKIISSIRFFGRQGLPLRSGGPHNDLDSNFYQLLLL